LSSRHAATTHDIVFLSHRCYLRSLISQHAHAFLHRCFSTWSCSLTH
uniref:Ovule protein n=1 Tax=Hydatigena taeniaeformis TaxID=6205 RepID=A0A0R3WIE2_HYDTA